MHDLGAGPESERLKVLIRGPLWLEALSTQGMSGWRVFVLRERFAREAAGQGG